MKIKISIFHWLGIAAGAAMVALSVYACIEGGSSGLLTIPVAIFGGLGGWMAWLDMSASEEAVAKRAKRRPPSLWDQEQGRQARYGQRWSGGSSRGWSGRRW